MVQDGNNSNEWWHLLFPRVQEILAILIRLGFGLLSLHQLIRVAADLVVVIINANATTLVALSILLVVEHRR